MKIVGCDLHARQRSPNDFVSPRPLFTSAVRACTRWARARITASCACAWPLPCFTGANHWGSIRASGARVLASSRCVFLPALGNPSHVARMGHHHVVTYFFQQPVHPGRMRPGLQCYPAA